MTNDFTLTQTGKIMHFPVVLFVHITPTLVPPNAIVPEISSLYTATDVGSPGRAKGLPQVKSSELLWFTITFPFST